MKLGALPTPDGDVGALFRPLALPLEYHRSFHLRLSPRRVSLIG